MPLEAKIRARAVDTVADKRGRRIPLPAPSHVRGSSRPPTSSAVLNSWKELFCEFTRVGAGGGSTPAAIRQVFGEAGHTTKTT